MMFNFKKGNNPVYDKMPEDYSKDKLSAIPIGFDISKRRFLYINELWPEVSSSGVLMPYLNAVIDNRGAHEGSDNA